MLIYVRLTPGGKVSVAAVACFVLASPASTSANLPAFVITARLKSEATVLTNMKMEMTTMNGMRRSTTAAKIATVIAHLLAPKRVNLIALSTADVDNMQARSLSTAIDDPSQKERSQMATRLRALHRRKSLAVRKFNQELNSYIKKYSAPEWPISRNYADSLMRGSRRRQRLRKKPAYKKMVRGIVGELLKQERESGESKRPGMCGTIGCNKNFYDWFPQEFQK